MGVRHLTLQAHFTKAQIKEGAVFCPPVARWNDMTVDALRAFLAVAVLEKVAACRDLVLLVAMQVLAVTPLFALAFEPVNADDLLVLGLI